MRFHLIQPRRDYFRISDRDKIQFKKIDFYCKRNIFSRNRFIKLFQTQIRSRNRYRRDSRTIGSICQLSLKEKTQSIRIRSKSKKSGKISQNKKNKLSLIKLLIQYQIQKWAKYLKKQKISKLFLRINPQERIN